MTLDTRQVEQVDFMRLVQDAIEMSEVVTSSGPASQMKDREGLDLSDTISFGTRYVNKFGSFWETLGDIVDVVVGGPTAVVDFVVDAVEAWLGDSDDGGPGTGNAEAQGAVEEVLESVTRSESHRMVTETTTSRSSMFERTVSRTFVNPYRDRSLQLRFIPVFRRFEVVTGLLHFHHGLVLELMHPRFKQTALSARLGDFIQRQVADPRIISIASSELGLQDEVPVRKTIKAVSPLTEHLNANAEFYAKRYLRYLYARRDLDALQPAMLNALGTAAGKRAGSTDLQNALVWSRTQVQGKAIYVPLAGGNIAEKALRMEKASKKYLESIERIEKFLNLELRFKKRDVHLFMGTHIEPVAGECLLSDVPPVSQP
ncbi:MAG: hypothetical protein NT002_13795 [candidate division Zixibacteria bacterium]|nr:hypothetical protein [candidate division Zixibacteria bacterium]